MDGLLDVFNAIVVGIQEQKIRLNVFIANQENGIRRMSAKLKRRIAETYQYPNAHQLRLNVLAKRNLVGDKCQRCGKKGNIGHHIDLGRKDHSFHNLMIVCRMCHGFLHSKKNPAFVEKWKDYEIR